MNKKHTGRTDHTTSRMLSPIPRPVHRFTALVRDGIADTRPMHAQRTAAFAREYLPILPLLPLFRRLAGFSGRRRLVPIRAIAPCQLRHKRMRVAGLERFGGRNVSSLFIPAAGSMK